MKLNKLGYYSLLSLGVVSSILPFNASANTEEDEAYYDEEYFLDDIDYRSEGIEASSDPYKDAFQDGFQSIYGPSYQENIDKYSGSFRITSVDLSYPGKGGLDLVIQRFYNSKIWNRTDNSEAKFVPNKTYGDHMAGSGWKMHFGQLWNPDGSGSNLYASQNPVLELSDGTSIVFYKSKDSSNRFLSRERWILDKGSSGLYTVTSPSGFVYTFKYQTGVAGFYDLSGVYVAECTEIKNLFGNAITITYKPVTNSVRTYIDSVSDTYGRSVSFSYDSSYWQINRVSVTSGSSTESYDYTYGTTLMTDSGRTSYGLTKVTPPSGNYWEFAYNSGNTDGEGLYALKKATNPLGGVIEYTYKPIKFNMGGNCEVEFSSLYQRKLSGRDVDSATYTFSYSNPGDSTSTTTVSGPNSSSETYSFYGWDNDDYVWRVGKPKESTISYGGKTTSTTYSWAEDSEFSYDDVSNPSYSNCVAGYTGDTSISYVIPSSIRTSISLNSATYTTTQSSFDSYGNPRTISESGQRSKTTTYGYWYNSSKNIVTGKVSSAAFSDTSASAESTGTASYTYDDYGRLTSKNLYGVSTSYTYNSSTTEVASETDANSKTTSYSNYSYGVPGRITFANSKYITREINGNATIKSETNENGNKTSFGYDGLRRLTSVTPPSSGSSTSISYTSDNGTKTVTTGSYVTKFYFDGFGKLTKTYDQTRNQTKTLDYNANEFLSSEKYTFGSYTGDSIDYNSLGKITKRTRPDGSYLSYSYGSNYINQTDSASGKSIKLYYDGYSSPDGALLTKVTDEASKNTTYSYNGFGSLTQITAPSSSGNISYDYNSSNFLTSESSSATGSVTYGRDSVGNMTYRTDGAGKTSYGYDSVYRVTSIDYPSTSDYDVTFGYDSAGNRTSASNSYVGITYGFDSSNRVTSKAVNLKEISKTLTTSFSYDSIGNITRVTYPSGRTASYTYNSSNQVTAVGGTTTYASSVSYHSAGPMTAFTLGNSVATSIGLDSRYRVKTIKAPSDGSILNLTYNYSGNNVSSITDGRDSTKTMSFSYDSRDQLIQAVASGLWGTLDYTYDDLGNRTKEVLTKTSALTTNYTYSSDRLSSTSGNRVGSYTYDSAGKLTSRTVGGITRTFTYGGNSYLTSSQKSGSAIIEKYSYDPDGLRVKSDTNGVITYFIHDIFGHVIAEYSSSGTLNEETVYLNGTAIAKFNSSSTATYFHNDALGTPLAHTNSSKTVLWRGAYEPFGTENYSSATTTETQKFTGKEFDSSLNLYYYGARYFDSLTGRFITTDQAPPSLTKPLSFNRYAYSLNNPVKYVDSTGNFWETALDVIGVAMDIHTIATTGVSAGNLAMLGADIAGMLIPGIPSPASVKIGKEALEKLGTSKLGRELVQQVSNGVENVAKQLDDVGGFCFSAGTPILTESGFVSIENIKVGDVVFAFNPDTNELSKKEVSQLFVTKNQSVIELSIVGLDGKNDVIGATLEHPFWVKEKGWTPANQIKAGDELFSSTGGWLRVSGSTFTSRKQTVYNFEVEDFHTYFAGSSAVLVHNKCNVEAPKKLPRYEGKKPAYTVNAKHDPTSGKASTRGTPLPSDAEDVYKHAVPDASENARNWFGMNKDGDIYRFSNDGVGGVHYSGQDNIGDGIRNITPYAKERLAEMASKAK